MHRNFYGLAFPYGRLGTLPPSDKRMVPLPYKGKARGVQRNFYSLAFPYGEGAERSEADEVSGAPEQGAVSRRLIGGYEPLCHGGAVTSPL